MKILGDRLFVALAKRVGFPSLSALRTLRRGQARRIDAGAPLTLFSLAREEGLLEASEAERFVRYAERVVEVRPRYARDLIEAPGSSERALDPLLDATTSADTLTEELIPDSFEDEPCADLELLPEEDTPLREGGWAPAEPVEVEVCWEPDAAPADELDLRSGPLSAPLDPFAEAEELFPAEEAIDPFAEASLESGAVELSSRSIGQAGRAQESVSDLLELFAEAAEEEGAVLVQPEWAPDKAQGDQELSWEPGGLSAARTQPKKASARRAPSRRSRRPRW